MCVSQRQAKRSVVLWLFLQTCRYLQATLSPQMCKGLDVLTVTEKLECGHKVTVTHDGQRQEHVEDSDDVQHDSTVPTLLLGEDVTRKLFHCPRRAVGHVQQVSGHAWGENKHSWRLKTPITLDHFLWNGESLNNSQQIFER